MLLELGFVSARGRTHRTVALPLAGGRSTRTKRARPARVAFAVTRHRSRVYWRLPCPAKHDGYGGTSRCPDPAVGVSFTRLEPSGLPSSPADEWSDVDSDPERWWVVVRPGCPASVSKGATRTTTTTTSRKSPRPVAACGRAVGVPLHIYPVQPPRVLPCRASASVQPHRQGAARTGRGKSPGSWTAHRLFLPFSDSARAAGDAVVVAAVA
jgi:hypothetical protein